jgi:hypothetical protein
VARFLWAPGASNHNGRPLTEFMTFKKSQLFIEFPFIWLNILNVVERRQLTFFFIWSTPHHCPPLSHAPVL